MVKEIGHFIGGKHVKGTSGRFADVFNPNTGEIQARVALASPAELRAAVENAKAAQPVTAEDPAIRRTLAGLAMAGLLDRGLFSGSPDTRRHIAVMAGEVLHGSTDERVHLAAEVGHAEQRLAEAQARNGAEQAALGIARSALISADPFAAASGLEAARLQLETIYAVTARLSGMSLLGMLR